MKIYLLDINPTIIQAWQQFFNGCKDVVIVHDDFRKFMDKNKVDCIVSPGNSQGIMKGGYDYAISDYFGWELTNRVQEYIQKNYKGGYQPIGTAFIFPIPNSDIKLIHCPTMIRPMVIYQTKVIEDCMYATLKVAHDNKIKSIVIPAFGGATGQVNPNEIAKLMYQAYQRFNK